MSLSTGEVVRIRIYSRMGGALAVNVTNWEVSMIFGSSIGDEQPVADRCDQAMSVLKAVISPSAEYRGIVLDDDTPFGSLACFAGSSLQRGMGTATGDPLPPAVCGVITRRTGRGGLGQYSRFFVPFLSRDTIGADGDFNDDGIAAMDIIGSAIDSSISTFTEGILVTLTPIHLRRTVPDKLPFTSRRSNRRPGAQRRRNGYRVQNSCPFGM